MNYEARRGNCQHGDFVAIVDCEYDCDLFHLISYVEFQLIDTPLGGQIISLSLMDTDASTSNGMMNFGLQLNSYVYMYKLICIITIVIPLPVHVN